MYTPDHFRMDERGAQQALMRAHPFATLITAIDGRLDVTHLPTVLKAEDGAFGTIECHLARANPHWRTLRAPAPSLVIFNGPEAYVTPGWYPSKTEHGKVVPTWNYAVVHAHGIAEAIDDRDWLVRHVGELTDQHEAGSPAPWATSDAPADFIAVMARGIVGVRFRIERIEGKWKMSQNRPEPDRHGVAGGLLARHQEGDEAVSIGVSEALARGKTG